MEVLETKAGKRFWWIGLVLIYLLAWQIQNQLFLNYDVGWLLYAAKQLLAGGSYSQHFFETNPPLILYLYFPPLLFHPFLDTHLISLFRLYIFLYATLSLYLSYGLLQPLLAGKGSSFRHSFLLALALVFLVLPLSSFGQRDHLVILFSLPYILLLANRRQGTSISWFLALGIGLYAGLGFAIKPHFLLPLIFLETHYAFHQKSWRSLLRPELLCLLGFLIFYGLSIFILHPDYLYLVAPFTFRLYYAALGKSWIALFWNPLAYYCLFVCLFYGVQVKSLPYHSLATVLLISLLGFFASFLSQQMRVYYHELPPLSFASLLGFLLLLSLLPSIKTSRIHSFFIAALALFVFSMPLKMMLGVYCLALDYKKSILTQLVPFINENAENRSIYFLSRAGYYAFPTLYYTHSQLAPRFYFFWMAAGIWNQADLHKEKGVFQKQLQRDKNFLMNMVADDLFLYKPYLVFVDQMGPPFHLRGSSPFFFADHLKFQQQWHHYAYFTSLHSPGRFDLAVFRRENESHGPS